MRNTITFFRTKYDLFTHWCHRQYNTALRIAGIDDSPEVRITAAVAVCVTAFYLMMAFQYLISLLPMANQTLTALVQAH